MLQGLRENEQFKGFYAKLSDITNLVYTLEKKYPESMIMKKILRLLPDRFHSKVIVIEEQKQLRDKG